MDRVTVPPSMSSTVRAEAGVRNGSHRRDGRHDRVVLVDEVVLDDGEHERGGPDLQERRDLAEVGVADDDVQPPVLLGSACGSYRC